MCKKINEKQIRRFGFSLSTDDLTLPAALHSASWATASGKKKKHNCKSFRRHKSMLTTVKGKIKNLVKTPVSGWINHLRPNKQFSTCEKDQHRCLKRIPAELQACRRFVYCSICRERHKTERKHKPHLCYWFPYVPSPFFIFW